MHVLLPAKLCAHYLLLNAQLQASCCHGWLPAATVYRCCSHTSQISLSLFVLPCRPHHCLDSVRPASRNELWLLSASTLDM